MARKQNLVDKWIASLKARPAVAAAILGAAILAGVGGVFKGGQSIIEAIQVSSDALGQPSVVAFTLSPRATGFEESRDPLFGASEKLWRTFEPAYPFQDTPVAMFLVTIKNPTRRDLIITRVDYDVQEVGEVKGAPSGPLEPLATYHHSIVHLPGVQPAALIPPFRVSSKDSASLELQVTSASDGWGLGWLLRIGFASSSAEFYTDTVQLYLPKAGTESPQKTDDKKGHGSNIMPNDSTSDMLARPAPVQRLPSSHQRDCTFRMAGIERNISGLDALDRDVLYWRAAALTPAIFSKQSTQTDPPVSYAVLIPAEGRNKLQTIIKTHLACDTGPE
jgi:hypothetical protein